MCVCGCVSVCVLVGWVKIGDGENVSSEGVCEFYFLIMDFCLVCRLINVANLE